MEKKIKKFKTNQFISSYEDGKIVGTYITHSYIIENDCIYAVLCGSGNHEHLWDSLSPASKNSLRICLEKEGILIKNK